MKWFFALDEGSVKWFSDMVKVAVRSAQENASLEPYCLYDGSPNELTDWMRAQGVTVIGARVPFFLDLFSDKVVEANQGSFYSAAHASGAFLRILVPNFCRDETVLYTDCDVMFLSDPKPEPGQEVRFRAVREVLLKDGNLEYSRSFNSGILLFDTKYFESKTEDLCHLLRENNYYFKDLGSYDQVALNSIFACDWESLPEIWNWRPFQGLNQFAHIVHFHGPKPHRIRDILDGSQNPEEGSLRGLVMRSQPAYEYYVKKFYDFLATC